MYTFSHLLTRNTLFQNKSDLSYSNKIILTQHKIVSWLVLVQSVSVFALEKKGFVMILNYVVLVTTLIKNTDFLPEGSGMVSSNRHLG